MVIDARTLLETTCRLKGMSTMNGSSRLYRGNIRYRRSLTTEINGIGLGTISIAKVGGNISGRLVRTMRALPLDGLDASSLDHVSHMLSLLYEPVVLPCSSMNCGDIVYRSTLDPVLRMEQRVLSPQGLLLLAATFSYLFSKPGVLQGMVDTYVSAPLQRLQTPAYCLDDVKVGKKLAVGGFGTVYTGELLYGKAANTKVILKKATEFGEAEVWMNERMMRAAPGVAARFISAFEDSANPKPGDPLWLMWQFEGTDTLADLMKARNKFPENMEEYLFDKPLSILPGPIRRAVAIRVAMMNLLESLKACHSIGIVHRDVKPQNFVLAENDKKFKLIDFGAAADLRVGINYVPNQYLLDPRYAPPEQYIMSAQTPRAPPTPVAAFLSPVLWQLNGPDKFYMYSVGITLLQMAFAPLRSDNGLIAFNKSLGERYNWDLNAWRRSMEKKGSREWVEGFQTLDALGGGGWDLAVKLVQREPTDRLTASAALAHPWFDSSFLAAMTSTVEDIGRSAVKVTTADGGWLQKQIARSGAGGFTEAQLSEELDNLGIKKKDIPAPRASNTIVWWQSRQKVAQQQLKDRMGRGLQNARKTVKESTRRAKSSFSFMKDINFFKEQ
jgi:serine/threonine protein kinase